MWNLNYDTNEPIYETETDSQVKRRLVVAIEEGGCGRRMDWEIGVNICKPLYIEWINNKVPLYSTGNYIQYLVINRKGK